MSRQIIKSNNQNQKQKEQKKFCKVCFDAGKPESLYTNHYVRAGPEPSANITCPTLLEANCNYCHGTGHTPAHCKLLKSHQKEKMRAELAAKKAEEEAKSAKKVEKKISSKGFAALMDSSDDEEEKPILKAINNIKSEHIKTKATYKTDFPELSLSTSSSSPAPLKTTTKSHLAATLKQVCPELQVGAKMPEVNTYRPPVAQLVRRPRKLTPVEEQEQFINTYIANQLKSDPKHQIQNKLLTKNLADTPKKYHRSHYGEEDLLREQQAMCNSNGYDVTKLYKEAFEAYKVSQLASNIDWAQEEADSSDDEELEQEGDEDW
jgi:uncharacterized protein YbbK (DUF523 family)